MFKISSKLAIGVVSLACGSVFAGVDTSKNIIIHADLGGTGHEVLLDSSRDLVYVAIPLANEIAVVSSITGEVLDRVFVGPSPRGMDLSHDGQRAYIALNQAASVVSLDLDTYELEEYVVGDLIGSSLTWDVVETSPGRVFASANPYSSGFARIVQINIETKTVTGAASGRIIRASPTFHKDPTGEFLYVGESFSPNSLYKLDLNQPSAPIILEDNHGSVSGTTHGVVSPDGSRIYLAGSQVLRTDSFLLAGQVGGGRKALTSDGGTLFTALGSRIILYNTQTFLPVETIELPNNTSVSDIKLFDDDSGYVYLSGSTLTLNVPSRCPYDFVADNQLDFNDINAFINLFAAGSPDVDLNKDGTLDFFDISTFIQAITMGCE